MKNRVIILKPHGLIIKKKLTKATVILGTVLMLLISVSCVWLYYSQKSILTRFTADTGSIEKLQNENKELQTIIDDKQRALEVFENSANGIPVAFLETINKYPDISIISISTDVGADAEFSDGYTVSVKGLADSNERISMLAAEFSTAGFIKDYSIVGIEQVMSTTGTKQVFYLEIKLL